MTLVLTHITTSKILSALLLQLYAYMHTRYAKRIFEFYILTYVSYPKVGEFLLRYVTTRRNSYLRYCTKST